jgi:murein DD-endopeptidase MepM/ murein hydrolase activator NlpD
MYRSSLRSRRPFGRTPRARSLLIPFLVFGIAACVITFLVTGIDGDSERADPGPGMLVQLDLPNGAPTRPAQRSNGYDDRLPFEPIVPGGRALPEGNLKNESAGRWINVTVAAGDNLSLIFSRLTLSKRDLHSMVSLGDVTTKLKHIKPGQIVRIRVKDDTLEEMVLELDQLNSLHVVRDGKGFTAFNEFIEPEIKITTATTEITQSLFVDGQKAGLSDAMIMRLTDIFGWDIDFALDLRDGDRFSVIYEEIFKGEEFIKQDRILAAEFVNRGKRLRAVLYTDEQGRSAYYSDQGEAMRKAFLRTPVDFTRISSRFNLRRKHPILNTIRAHRGVDYAAPSGTPVRATADGRIKSIGRNGGYGKTIEMQHGETYSTLYAHLSRYARGMKRGRPVSQGQIIGYVGKSGLATGPHLHYEFRIHGVHRNPLTVDLPKAEPIDKKYLRDFQEQAKPLLAQLDVLLARRREPDSNYVAQLDSPRATTSRKPINQH